MEESDNCNEMLTEPCQVGIPYSELYDMKYVIVIIHYRHRWSNTNNYFNTDTTGIRFKLTLFVDGVD